MNKLQVSVACVLLTMTFDLVAAQILQSLNCPTCAEGYFVTRNCSVRMVNGQRRLEGIQCRPCTSCSAADQVTLVGCSRFSDSVCGNRSSPVVTGTTLPTEAAVSAPEVWIILTVMALCLVLVLLLTLFLVLLRCRKQNKLKALDPL